MKKDFVKIKSNEAGFVFLLVIVATSFFLLFFSGMITLALSQKKLYTQQTAKQQALHMAEAGANYYIWRLAHSPDDFCDGNVCEGDPPYGPYEHEIDIPNSDLSGFFSLMIYPPEEGSDVIAIQSQGWVSSHPNARRTIEAKYGKISLGSYSFLTNSDVWFGENETTIGLVHSNGGVRMDGRNESTVSSARDVYICTSAHDCDSSKCFSPCEWQNESCYCPGVWGDGPDNSLWSYPVSSIDFDSITLNIADIKESAKSGGQYFSKLSSGYHIIFKPDASFDIYEVKNLEAGLWQKNDDWSKDIKISEEPKTEFFIANYSIPENGLIFVEGDVWVEGTVNGHVTLVSAILPDVKETRTTVHINNNLTYLSRDGSSSLGIIAQKHIKVPRHAPSDLTIDGVLLAQHGRVFRNYYSSQLLKSRIEVYGSIITNNIWTWTWVNSIGSPIDGYIETHSIYDPHILNSPPPFFPTLGVHELVSWKEYSWKDY